MNSTYTLVKADIGSTITVEISSSEETGTLTSAATAAVKKADSPGAPTGLNGVNPTTLGGSDGKITGTTTAMEYSTDSNFASPAGTVCSGTEITGLTAGTYYVRIAETDTHFAGATATVTVPADDVPLTYTATVTPDGKTFAARTVGYGEQTAETFTITNTGTGALASLDVTLTGANADSFTLDAINSTLSGCGIKALAEETEKKGTVKVWFPNTVGVPDEFSQVESIILDIIPCHLLVEFYFRYLTWLECERVGFTWQSVEDAHHTWESFEKAVPEEE